MPIEYEPEFSGDDEHGNANDALPINFTGSPAILQTELKAKWVETGVENGKIKKP